MISKTTMKNRINPLYPQIPIKKQNLQKKYHKKNNKLIWKPVSLFTIPPISKVTFKSTLLPENQAIINFIHNNNIMFL